MSAPSYAKFYHHGELIFSAFVNIGWFYIEERLIEELINALTEYHEALGVQDFDHVQIYHFTISIQDLIRWKRREITHSELLECSYEFPPTERT